MLEVSGLASELGDDPTGREPLDELDGRLVRVEPATCERKEGQGAEEDSHDECVSAAVVAALEGELADYLLRHLARALDLDRDDAAEVLAVLLESGLVHLGWRVGDVD